MVILDISDKTKQANTTKIITPEARATFNKHGAILNTRGKQTGDEENTSTHKEDD